MTIDDVLAAIDAEPEYEGPATLEFLAEQDAKGRGDDARLFIKLVRMACRDTKAGIRARVLAMAEREAKGGPR